MAKKKQNESEELPEGEVSEVKAVDPAHLKPQEEPSGPPARPKAVDPKHLKPQE